MSQGIKVIFGTASFGGYPVEKNEDFLDQLEKAKINHLDTARQYNGSEKMLNILGAPSRFVIDTKVRGFAPETLTRDAILDSSKGSFEDLGIASVETYYLHSPDPAGTAIEETVDTIDELYKQGRFKHFGLSNFTPEQVKAIHSYATKAGKVAPTVYQGNYNPVARRYDTTLLPLLRELKIAFYAYSPLAGGFLVKDVATLKGDNSQRGGQGRWDPSSMVGAMYHDRYNRPALLQALTDWENIAQDAGVSKAELAYRWVRYNSMLKPEHGDAIILGASSGKQLEETLRGINKGPLEEGFAKTIDKVWDAVKDEAPIDNFHL